MGLKTAPAYIGQTGYLHPVELDRNLIEGIFGRTGVLRVGDFAVTPTGVSGQLSVAAGRASLVGVESAAQGAYFVWSDGADLMAVAAASGNPRIDSVILRVKDDQYGTISGSPQAYLEVVQGVAAASPVARADSYFNSGGGAYVPGAWFRLADVRRNLGDTTIPGGQITSNLLYVRIPGGRTVCTSTTRPSDAVVGDQIYEIDTGLLRYYTGSVWKLIRPWESTQELSGVAANITFSNIPTDLKNLEVYYTARGNQTGFVAQQLLMRVNNDTGVSYVQQTLQANNTTAGASINSGGSTSYNVGMMARADASAGVFGSGRVSISGWNAPHSNHLGIHSQSEMIDTGTNFWSQHNGGRYSGAGPYNRLDFLPDGGSFVADTQITVQGWD